MSEIAFDFEWIDPLGARGRELRATWARLEIVVDGKCITRVLDQGSRSVRDAVYLPLYPLAAWLATHWWNILFEVESPERIQDPSYCERHSFRAAREGFALPAASISALGDRVRLAWLREVLPNHRLEFIEQGVAYIPLEFFRRSAQSLIAAVITRLDEHDITDTVLHQEWPAVEATMPDEMEFCVAAAALGLDPFAMANEAESSIIEAARAIPENVRRDFFDVANARELAAQASDVAQTLEAVRETEVELDSLVELRQMLADRSTALVAPWEQGYSAARRLRDTLNLDNTPLQSFEDIAKALRVSNGDLLSAFVHTVSQEENAWRMWAALTGNEFRKSPIVIYDALVATNRRHSPSFAVSHRHSEVAQRFHFCRALYEFLQSPDDGPWLVTRSLSDRQKRSRAFAAEFLAPAAAIREMTAAETISVDDVEEIATRFGVSSYVIQHQLDNHRIATIVPS